MADGPRPSTIALRVNDVDVEVPDVGETLLDVLRARLGLTGAKDGCSPQGQCGCCTVLVDGQPRVACVTPVRRVRGRAVTTIEGLDPARAAAWSEALCATGGSQCGFCTPGIVLRLDALAQKTALAEEAVLSRESSPSHGTASAGATTAGHRAEESAAVDQALLAHLCRCTGWQTISEAWQAVRSGTPVALSGRDFEAAARRAELEGGTPQLVDPSVAMGHGGFAADTAPVGSLVAIPDGSDGWVVAETLARARADAGRTQGRRTTVDHHWPLDVPHGPWDAELRTTWVEPAYLETDAAWCEPGGEPSTILANGGAFGAKAESPVIAACRQLASTHERPVLALASREDTVRWGPKRPPVAGGARADGTGTIRVVASDGVSAAISAVAPGLVVEELEVAGPSTSTAIRGAGWVEAIVLLAGARGEVGTVTAPNGAKATAAVHRSEGLEQLAVWVSCGQILDEVVLRSYCIGAAHMAASWVRHEALTVDADGLIHDLTVRSFGIMRAVDTPTIDVTIAPSDEPPINGSDAVFAAVAAAIWLEAGLPHDWPLSVSGTPGR